MNRPVTVTEKIDGTNAAVVIEQHPTLAVDDTVADDPNSILVLARGSYFSVAAQSRKRLITPDQDNYGFATWVWNNAVELAKTLGEGRHFGEWWGSGINRGYGLTKGEKRFSLFNTKRWDVLSEKSTDRPLGVLEDWTDVPGLRVVPTIAEYDTFDSALINDAIKLLRGGGSFASPGFDQPEGVVVYHHAANSCFKVLLEGDEIPKNLVQASAARIEKHGFDPVGVAEAMERRARYA